MPPLYIALVDIHKEYTQMNMVAKDMAGAYRTIILAGNQLQKQYEQSAVINKEISEKLQHTEDKLKEAKEQALE